MAIQRLSHHANNSLHIHQIQTQSLMPNMLAERRLVWLSFERFCNYLRLFRLRLGSHRRNEEVK